MKKYLQHQKKVYLNSILPVLLALLLAVVVFITFRQLIAIDRKIYRFDELKQVITGLDVLKNTILADHQTKDFSLDNTDKIVEQKISSAKNNYAIINESIHQTKFLNKKLILNIIDSIDVNFDYQVNALLQLNAILKQLNTETSSSNNELENLKNKLSEDISSSVSKAIQNLLISQISFLTDKNTTTYSNLISNLNSVESVLSEQEVPDNDLLTLITSLKKSTNSIMKLSRKVGSENTPGGLIHELKQNQKSNAKRLSNLDRSITKMIHHHKLLVLIISSVIGLILFVSVWLLYYSRTEKLVNKPFEKIISFADKIKTGAIPENKLQINTKDELEKTGVILNQFVQSLKDKTLFLNALIDGDLDAKLSLLSNYDLLGKALLDIQVKIQQSAEEQKKHDEENTRRRYINEGIAKFSDITHARYDKIEALTDIFIRELVKYLNSLQGGVFLVKEAEVNTELFLASSFAYDRKKYLSKTVVLGEGLVGTCALEKRMILITDVPSDYITITSGLGDAPPNAILLIPMLQDNLVAGVIEIASLNKFADYQIEFVKQVANNLANTLASARINERTSKLLAESQVQAQTMSEQEEEMRQNMEELKATQEESARREEEFKGIAEALGKSIFVAEFDLKGQLTSINDKFLVFLGKNRNQLLGKTFDKIIGADTNDMFNDETVEEVLNGKHLVLNEQIKIGKRKDFKVQFHFTPELNRDEFPFKILCLGIELI